MQNYVEVEKYLADWDKLFSKGQAFMMFILLAISMTHSPFEDSHEKELKTVLFYE